MGEAHKRFYDATFRGGNWLALCAEYTQADGTISMPIEVGMAWLREQQDRDDQAFLAFADMLAEDADKMIAELAAARRKS